MKECRKWRNWLRNELEELQSRLRSADKDYGAQQGRYDVALWCVIDSAKASRVKFITGDGPNVPRYSLWENITVACFPLPYWDSAQWIAAAASATECGARGSKYWDVVGWRPTLLAVKKHWWHNRSSTSIRVNQDFLSSMTLDREASSNRSFLTLIRSSVS